MSGLFWSDRTHSATKAEAEQFRSPEETGRRVVSALRAWLARALRDLPAEAREWYPIELDPPEWLDSGYPHLALNECRRLVNGIPQHRAGWHACSEDDAKRILEAGKNRIAKAGGVDPDEIADSEVLLIKLSPSAARAVAVLHAARSAVAATESVPAPAALVLLERALDFGINLARAHIRPWEATYTRYKDAQAAKASLGAEARWSGEDRGRLTKIIKRLATKTEWGEYPEPSELWLDLFGDMDSAGLSPCDTGEAYTYGSGETITKDAFRKRVQRLRQQK